MPATEVRTPSSVAAFGFEMSSLHAPIAVTSSIAAVTAVAKVFRVISFIVVSPPLKAGREGERDTSRYWRGREAEPAYERPLCSCVRFRIPAGVVSPRFQIAPSERD